MKGDKTGPRRGNEEGYVKEYKPGKWVGRIRLDGARPAVYGKSRREVLDKLSDLRRRSKQRLVLKDTETVDSYLTRWITDVIYPHREYRTFLGHRGNAVNHLIPILGHIRLSQLSVADVRDLINGYLGTYKAGTINQIRATLVAALNEAIRERLIDPPNVAALVPKVKPDAIPKQPLSQTQAKKFLAAVKGDRLEALYTVALVSGLRINEALGLTWDRVNLETGEMVIDRQLQRQPGGFVLKLLKSRASNRTITLPHYARAALTAHRQRQEHEQRAMKAWRNSHGLVFTGPEGQPLYDARIRELWRRYCTEAELPPSSPHSGRHTAASLLAAQGVPEVDVARLLGHASTLITRQVYQKSYAASQEMIAATMDTLFAANPSKGKRTYKRTQKR